MLPRESEPTPDDHEAVAADLVQLARLALSVGNVEVSTYLRRVARRYKNSQPMVASQLIELLRASPVRGTGTNAAAVADPVDADSRLPLVREEYPVELAVEPVFSDDVRLVLEQIRAEHLDPAVLLNVGLAATRTALFLGPPGVGKTLAARWLARELDKPLLILDLASVMSSFLGKTGTNVRRVLDYAKQRSCVLLLDELDAVAKRRDDTTEIGELKRLVTVLLQEIDAWPEGSLLLAASNHAGLLDPAVWRRFEIICDFPLPGQRALRSSLEQFLTADSVPPEALDVVAAVYEGVSFSEMERDAMRARRTSAVQGTPVGEVLVEMSNVRMRERPTTDRVRLAVQMVTDLGLSQRKVQEISGVSRDTLRKHLGSAQQSI